jgi:hypothetical protein
MSTKAPDNTVEKKHHRDAVEWAAFIALIVTLGLNIWQAHRLNATFHTSNWMSIENQVLDLDKTFISHPELQPFFFSGEDVDPKDKLYAPAFAQAQYIADFLDSTMSIADRTDPIAFTPEAWRNYYKHLFLYSPILCKVVLGDREVYGPRIVATASQYCGQHMAPKAIYPEATAPDAP